MVKIYYNFFYTNYPKNKVRKNILLRYLRETISAVSDKELQTDYSCPIPSVFCIEPGNICNLRCQFCPTGLGYKEFSKGFLRLENFKIIFEKIAPFAKDISLFNWGEPFLNKDLLPMISICADNGIRTQIHSNLNAAAFSNKEADAIVTSGLSSLVGSIDGAGQKSYEKYRKGGNFTLAINNLEQLQKAKIRLNSNTPILIWKFLVNKFNEHEIETAKRIAGDMGLTVEFPLMDVWDSSWGSSLHQKSPGSVLAEPERSPLPVRIDSLVLHSNLCSWCSQPFKMMFINWDGHILPCCNVFGEKYSLGNLLIDPIKQIWNNNRFRECRRFLYHYGSLQKTKSICETLPCPLNQKHL